MEATALHNFTARAEDELSFDKGSTLKVYTPAQKICVLWVGEG